MAINFAYHNHEMIELLAKRGAAITDLRFEDGGFPFYKKSIQTLDKEITDLLQNPEKYQHISQPVTAFITFESDDGKNEALSFSKQSMFFNKRNVHPALEDKTIMNEPPVFTQATEPTNIIWQNRYITGINYYARITAITIISVFMLVLAFLVIFFFKKSQIAISEKWPAINIKEMNKLYGEDLPKLAGLEYDIEVASDWKAPMQGFLEAFCKNQEKKLGPTGAYDLLHKEFTYTDANGKE